ncbi:hypothetical protein M408DRAFT_328654 [Serendipita vermifera MAFF 305830]|uniref:Zn(2)-C6 fungal-type domain-containing protein n=1 Tax=Serendipita vermifera MAFF 305830 TaxID=933852 RepID=A0A0C2WUM3_SERVB|nr:hypothetical protein M408DRAFT_328654 [Serendipita vermifera MAFF 305830]
MNMHPNAMQNDQLIHGNPAMQQASIPKRGARACTACRKGKNRCEGESPCRRCQLSGTQCVFEKPEKKSSQPAANGSIERVSRLEGQYLVMQSQMIGLQSSLDRILAQLQNPGPVYPPTPSSATAFGPPPSATGSRFPSSSGAGNRRLSPEAAYFPTTPGGTAAGPPRAGSAGGLSPPTGAEGGVASNSNPTNSKRQFPPLPGFAPPPHKYATYGIIASTAPSSDDESEDTLPRATLNAPIEALQGLANAAAEAAASAAAPVNSPPSTRPRKRKRVEPIPPNSFPHVVEKGLVSDTEARSLYNIFFSGCHLFIPLFDPAYDTYEGIKERSPFCFDAILAVAAKIRAGGGSPGPAFYRCLEEAQGIARSTLFGPVVRKEAVQAMLLLAAWSTSGWLPSGHAMRMALDLGLHRALEKLAETTPGRVRSQEEERDLVVSARIWLCLYWFDHQMSLGTGRPIVLRDEVSVRHCRILLNHQFSSPSDLRLVAQVELIAQKTQIYETLSPLNGNVSHATLSFIRRANVALDKWWADCDSLHRETMDEDSFLRKILIGELYYAKLWLVCVALRGASWDKMPFEQRELAFQAKEAASNCLATFLNSPAYRAALRYAVHDSLVTCAFSGLFLLKIANLFPGEVELPSIISQVEQLAQLLSEVAAERYALTIRLMLANLRRKLGLGTSAPTPAPGQILAQNQGEDGVNALMAVGPNGTGAGDTAMFGTADGGFHMGMEEFGFTWPADNGAFNPNSIPLWLQEASFTDLGLPINGSDGIFLNGPNWMVDLGPMPEAW